MINQLLVIVMNVLKIAHIKERRKISGYFGILILYSFLKIQFAKRKNLMEDLALQFLEIFFI